MNGFSKESNNIVFEQGLFDVIVLHVSRCCNNMQNDCREEKEHLFNHENKISNRLVTRYLNKNIKGIRFTLENPENYVPETDTFLGRTDIKVVTKDWFYEDINAYYTIESKRIDGNSDLNKKYVSDGIVRFVDILPKYSSFYDKNIMLGYVVRKIDIDANVKEIDKLQHQLLVGVKIGNMGLISDDDEGFSRYDCTYQLSNNSEVELAHLFYDFSSVVK